MTDIMKEFRRLGKLTSSHWEYSHETSIATFDIVFYHADFGRSFICVAPPFHCVIAKMEEKQNSSKPELQEKEAARKEV
ncbi:hypothetical protein ID850_19485 [Xenorhabdus sp. Flor]|nr:hypothetical protein [Xenorhabdus sp. Flor]